MKKVSNYKLFLVLIFIIAISVPGCSNNANVTSDTTTAGKRLEQEAGQKADQKVDQNKIIYQNKKYGFRFTLPKSWENYKIITSKWQGTSPDEAAKKVEEGPLISIRHPLWTAEKPRQDIPIMILTRKQWDDLQKEKFHIGAAPIGPTELGRNSKYVFALPARYNFAFPEGYEEVEKILQDKPLEPIEIEK